MEIKVEHALPTLTPPSETETSVISRPRDVPVINASSSGPVESLKHQNKQLIQELVRTQKALRDQMAEAKNETEMSLKILNQEQGANFCTFFFRKVQTFLDFFSTFMRTFLKV